MSQFVHVSAVHQVTPGKAAITVRTPCVKTPLSPAWVQIISLRLPISVALTMRRTVPLHHSKTLWSRSQAQFSLIWRHHHHPTRTILTNFLQKHALVPVLSYTRTVINCQWSVSMQRQHTWSVFRRVVISSKKKKGKKQRAPQRAAQSYARVKSYVTPAAS